MPTRKNVDSITRVNSFSNTPIPGGLKSLTLKPHIKKSSYHKLTSFFLIFAMLFQVIGGVFYVPKGNEVKASGNFDTSGQPITGNIYFASQLPNGNLLYAVARSGNPGVEEIDPSTNTVVFSWQDPAWVAGAGPESIYKYSNGNYLISDVDAQRATYEMRPDHTKVWSYTSSYTCDARPVVIDGVDAIILFAQNFSNITIIRRDNQQVMWTMSGFNYPNNGDFRVIDGQKYILTADYRDHKLYKINYDTKQIVWSYVVPGVSAGPYSAEWISDSQVLFSAGNRRVSEIINTENSHILWSSINFTGTTVDSRLTLDGMQVMTADSSSIIKFSSLPASFPIAAGGVSQPIKLSAVAGAAFADFSISGALSSYIGDKLVITDSAGRELTGYIKASGMGETLGGELHAIAGATSDPDSNETNTVTNWYNTSYPIFESSSFDKSTGSFSLHVISTGGKDEVISRATNPPLSGGLYKTTFDIKAVTPGLAKVDVVSGSGSNVYKIIESGQIPLDWTSYAGYYVNPYHSNYGGINIESNNSSCEIYADNLSVRQVLTPGPTGVTITSSSNGSVYDWASQDVGFRFSDSYTYAIYPGSYAMTVSDTDTHSYQLVDCNNTPGQAGVDVTGAATLQNFTVVRCPAGAFQFEQNATLVNSIGISSGDDLVIAAGKVVTGTDNLFGDSSKSGLGTYSDEDNTTVWSGDPLFVSTSDFHLQPTSSLVDSGTPIPGITADYVGSPIYGNPDIGAYEFQPPYSITVDHPNVSGVIRIYPDGKYRYTSAISGSTTAKLSVVPSSNSVDVSVNTWHTSTDYYKKWTESSTTHDLTTTHTIGDLQPNVRYTLKVDGQASDTYVANDQGQISFTYNSGYSTKTFELEETPSSSFIAPSKPSVSNLDITNNNGTLSLDNLPDTITQIAVSTSPDFTNSSWEDISKKDDLLKQYNNTDTLYIKFRTQEGGVSDTIIKEGNNIIGNEEGSVQDDGNIDTNNSNQPLQDGDIVKTPNNPDIYVIKYKNNKQYKRLLLSPTIFNSYLHLKWNNIKTISQQQLDQYQTSNLVKETTDTIIYQLFPNNDTGKRKPLDPSTSYDPDSVYEINKPERDSYELED